MENFSIKFVLGNSPLANGKYTVYLSIIKNRKRKRINVGFQCYEKNFNDQSFTKKHPNHVIENELLSEVKSKAFKTARKLQLKKGKFSLDEFELAFRGKETSENMLVYDFFTEIIDEFKRAKKISTSKAYKDTRESVKKFKGNHLKLVDITPTFLEKYEVFLRETGSKNGGISFRMRCLRALYNKARQRNILSLDQYPFKNYKISKLRTEGKKTSLSIEELKKIKEVDLSLQPHLLEAYNYFLFSIYTRGMNFQDMMHLKWDNINNGRISYIRSKTKGKINLEIIPPVQKILDHYKSQDRPTSYVFPILLKENLTPQQISIRKHKVLRRYNKKLKKIAELAEVDKQLTSYVARHTFATILKNKGTPIEKISEMMGHSDVSITITYLKEFSNEELDTENRKFIDL